MTHVYSKGPWTVFNNHNAHWQVQAASVGKGYWSTLGSFCQRDSHPVHGGAITVETAKANATLAAAAPDLLEALRILVAITSELPGTHGLAIDNARAAIAKATKTEAAQFEAA